MAGVCHGAPIQGDRKGTEGALGLRNEPGACKLSRAKVRRSSRVFMAVVFSVGAHFSPWLPTVLPNGAILSFLRARGNRTPARCR